MRDAVDDAHARNREELGAHARHVRGREAEAVHAGVDLDVAAHVRHAGAAQELDLPVRMDDGLDLQGLHGLNVRGVKEPFEQEQALPPAAAACELGVREINRRESVRVGEGRHGVLKSVAVGVGLDDGPDVSARGLAPHDVEVVAQRMEIDFSVDGTRHGGSSPKECSVRDGLLFATGILRSEGVLLSPGNSRARHCRTAERVSRRTAAPPGIFQPAEMVTKPDGIARRGAC